MHFQIIKTLKLRRSTQGYAKNTDHEFKIVQGGLKKPIHLPTEFGRTPSTFNQQSFSTTARNTAEQDITAEKRQKSSRAVAKDADRIKS